MGKPYEEVLVAKGFRVLNYDLYGRYNLRIHRYLD